MPLGRLRQPFSRPRRLEVIATIIIPATVITNTITVAATAAVAARGRSQDHYLPPRCLTQFILQVYLLYITVTMDKG